MFKFYLYFFLVCVCSCSKVSFNNKNQIHYSGVESPDVKVQEMREVALISKDNHQSHYGPNINTENTFDNIEKTSPNVSGVFFGASLYRAVNYIDILKKFEERKIPIHIFSGVGIGALVASMAAQGHTPELIEWKLYKLFSILSKEKVYDKEWLSILYTFIVKEFKEMKIEDTDKTLVLPLFNIKKKMTVFVSRGLLKDILFTQFLVESNPKLPRFLSALVANIDKELLISKFGTQKLFIVKITSDEILLKSPRDFIFGVYTKKFGYSKDNVENNNIYNILLPNKSIPLDSFQSSQIVKKYLNNKIDNIYDFYYKKINEPFEDTGQNDE